MSLSLDVRKPGSADSPLEALARDQAHVNNTRGSAARERKPLTKANLTSRVHSDRRAKESKAANDHSVKPILTKPHHRPPATSAARKREAAASSRLVRFLHPPVTGSVKAISRAAPLQKKWGSRTFTQKLGHASSSPFRKGPSRLPDLAPMDRKILAAIGERDWIKVDCKGTANVLRRDKHAVTHELGIQIRDLRLLDPLLASSYPSCILCREKALVINLEYIKCIITTSYVLILDANSAAVKRYISQLQQRLWEGNGSQDMEPASTVLSLARPSIGGPPFELKALEAALDEVSKHCEQMCSELEVSMRPILATTTAAKVTSGYLDRLRRIKSRLVRLKTRVETLKEVLEKYLDDEDDLKSVHLSGKLKEQTAAAFRRLARRSLREGSLEQRMHTPLPNASLPGMDLHAQLQADQDKAHAEAAKGASEVEMLLEAYYMSLDSTWNKLADMSELLDDAEELMDLEMDTYRNNIIRMKVFLGACHLLAGAIWAVANILGMNLGAPQDLSAAPTFPQFVQVSTLTCGIALLLMVVLTGYLHHRRLAITAMTG